MPTNTNFTSLFGVNFTAWPEMLAWPYLMLQGWLPYRDIAVAHSPLLLIELAIFYKLFGFGVLQLKIYTWILIAINAYLTYFVAKKYWEKKIAIFSVSLYLILCVIYEGNGLWFDLALAPFALLLYFLLKEGKYIGAGVIFALGLLTKQTFVWFLLPVLLFKFKQPKKLVFRKLISGGLVVAIIFSLILLIFGIFDDFYNWAIKFGIFYLPSVEGQISLPNLKQFVFAMSPLLIAITNPSMILWILAGIMGVYPRWELFHFQPALPFVAIAISSFMFDRKMKILKVIGILLLTTFILVGLKRQVGNNTRFVESEVIEIVNKIKASNVKEIYIINYWDNIYALTRTLPATRPLVPYIPWYLSYEDNSKKILDDLKIKMPAVILIGERDNINPKLYEFIDKLYTCNIIVNKVEYCNKNIVNTK